MENKRLCTILGSFLIALASFALACTAFLTFSWIKLPKIIVEAVSRNETIVIVEHGLWDNGLDDLNCLGTPIAACMATRAFIGASLAILCPSVLGLGTSLVVLVSGGSLLISANTATYSSVLLLVAALNEIIGLAVFTAYHSSRTSGSQGYGYSYFICWASFLFTVVSHVAALFYSVEVAALMKEKKSVIVKNDKAVLDIIANGNEEVSTDRV